MRQVPARLVKTVVVLDILERSSPMVQIAAHTDRRKPVIVLVGAKRTPGIERSKPRRVTEKPVIALKRHEAGFTREVRERGGTSRQNTDCKLIHRKHIRKKVYSFRENLSLATFKSNSIGSIFRT